MIFDFCVVPGVGLWQVAQPIELNSALPLEMELAETVDPFKTTDPVGGGASPRMKLANAAASSSMLGPVAPGLFVSSGYPLPLRFRHDEGSPVRPLLPLPSSPGNGRSCGNNVFEMPISTL